MNEKVKTRFQAAEMGFLRRISRLTLLDKAKSADIRESIHIESLLLRLVRSPLRWYGQYWTCDTNVPRKNSQKMLCTTPIGRRPRGRLRIQCRDYVKDLW